MTPLATYRIQFTPSFGFDEAAALVPYLAKLGVSHLYASPYLKARPGSTHGYDITDHTVINPELGGEAAFARMNEALKRHGLKQILDFVPNHMGVGGADNPFWLDVLEWGRDSAHAGWFDIDWDNDKTYLRDRLLVPFLGGQFGAELAAGKLLLKFDAEAGSFAVWAYDSHKLPVAPHCYADILGGDHPMLDRLGDAFANMSSWRPQVHERADALKAELAAAARDDAGAAKAIGAAVERYRGQDGDAESWAPLNRLIRTQHWRPAHFKVAGDDINYRRFFNINDLAGLRIEIPAVFDHAHKLVFGLMREGIIDGLRIDHVDGLFDPKGYLEHLRQEAPHSDESRSWYLIVEKILGEGEPLRSDWPVQGTTGYEVTNLLLGVMIDPEAEERFTHIYEAFIGQRSDYNGILHACKTTIMDNEMSSELDRLARSAARLARQVPSTEDFTGTILRRALREIIACFEVYRTYVDAQGAPTRDDRENLRQAIEKARPKERAIDGSVYDFLGEALIGDLARPGSGFSRMAVLRLAMKMQQYSGPVMAKGLEDTAFYRFNRFIALNEVGGHPTSFGRPLTEFHSANAERARHWPNSMLGTSTHDTKRGEDARARLAALSEHPEAWAGVVEEWSRILRQGSARADAEAPDRSDEYALYQLLLGTCPVELLDGGPAKTDLRVAYAERVKGAMTKAMREAKVHSTWAAPDGTYEAATLAFVDKALTGDKAETFLTSFLPFARTVAAYGARNSMIQTVLKLTMPGVPDLYQGTELWDLSMVDPDNRRPVDFALRTRFVEEITQAVERDRVAAMTRYAEAWQDGKIKLAITLSLLAFRNAHPALFAQGSYEPVESGSDWIGGFRRQLGEDAIVVAFSRFPGRGQEAAGAFGLPAMTGDWMELLTGRRIKASDVTAKSLFDPLPAAVLVRAPD